MMAAIFAGACQQAHSFGWGLPKKTNCRHDCALRLNGWDKRRWCQLPNRPGGRKDVFLELSPAKGRGATLLVVDDDALITLNTVDLLTEQGHVALEAYSGREALEILQSRSDIDALITDFGMPGMTGVELAEAARRLRPDLPVLLVTGYAELPGDAPGDLLRLEKPYDDDALAERVSQLLAPPAAQRSA
jgi:CheY-like chemotaxis protein